MQDVADFVGDSLQLARRCADMEAETVVFCGVRFMAETAAILNPSSTVILSHPTAGCPLADMISITDLSEWKVKYPEATVVAYVNATAAIKADSDICCTSANGVRVVESVPGGEILFIPDQHLGHYVSSKTKKRMILYSGFCLIHTRLNKEQVKLAKKHHPEAEVLVYPECRPEVIVLADAALGTRK